MKRFLNRFFLFLFLFLSGIILLICFTGTFHQIPFFYILIVFLLWLSGFFLLYLLLNKWKQKLSLVQDRWVFFFLFIWGVILFFFGNYIKGDPSSDYLYVYSFLMNWIHTDISDWSYFARWENNLPLFYLFAPIVKLGNLFGISDVQYPLAAFNTVMLAGTGYGIYYLIKEGFPELKNNVVVRWMALLLYMGFVPVWGSVFYVYSDSASMFFSVIGMALFLSKKKPSLYQYCIGGLCAGISYLIKPTAFFVILGLWLVLLILSNFYKYWKIVSLSACSALCIIILFQCSAHFMPHRAYLNTYKMPLQYWICIGMTKDGTYDENMLSLAIPFYEMNSYTERIEYGNQYIHEHSQNFYDMERILHKMQVNFANGLFGLNEYVSKRTRSFFDPEGIYNVHIVTIFSPYYYSMLFLLWCSGLFMLFHKSDLPGHELLKSIMAGLIGLILFLLIWEANNRQLYNQMPWFATGAALSINILSGFIFPKHRFPRLQRLLQGDDPLICGTPEPKP